MRIRVQAGPRLLAALIVAWASPSAAAPQTIPAPTASSSGGTTLAVVGVTDAGRLGLASGWALAGDRLFVTRDEGRTWNDVTATDVAAAPAGAGLAIAFADSLSIWAAAWAKTPSSDGSRSTVVRAAPAVRIWRSADGGRSWSSPDGPDLRALAIEPGGLEIAAISAREAWLLVRAASTANFSYGYLFRTTDGGATWQALPAPPIADHLSMTSGLEAWLAGGPSGSELYSSVDGGTVWSNLAGQVASTAESAEILRLGEPTRQEAGDVALPVTVRRREAIETLLFRTSDAGRSWRAESGRFRAVDRRGRASSTASAAAEEGETAEAVRLLLQLASPGVAWRARSVTLTRRTTATLVDAGSDGIAWLLLETSACTGVKRGCSRRSRLVTTSDGGRTLIDVTPTVLGVMAGSSQPPGAGPAAVEVSQSLGVDKCTAAPVAEMQTWWAESPFRDVNIYIGGVSRGCSQPLLTAQWVSEIWDQGWKLIPTWVGPQAPCTGCTTCRNRFSTDPAQAQDEGVREADLAANLALSLGLGVRTVIYFDLENYDWNNRPCGLAAGAFVGGWSRRIRERGHRAGVYGSATNALQDWFTIATPPDAVWIGKWDGRETVWGLTPLPDAWWDTNQRIHQYRGGHNETWGGVTFNIDNDIEDGPVAARDGAVTADTAGPDLLVSTPRPGHVAHGPVLVVSGTASDSGRGDSGIAAVSVNGERASGDTAGGADVASWIREIVLAPGENAIAIVAQDDSPAHNETRLALSVTYSPGGPAPPPPPPAELNIETTSPLPSAQAGEPYEAILVARGGTPSYAWTIAEGALPGGLSLDEATGLVHGTPVAVGVARLVLRVIDASGASAQREFSLAVLPAEPAGMLVLAEGLAAPLALAIDETHAYWLERDGLLRRVPARGGPAEALGEPFVMPRALALNAMHLFVADALGLWRIDKTTNERQRLASGNGLVALAADDLGTVWFDSEARAIRRWGPSTPGPETVAFTVLPVIDLSLQAGRIVWLEGAEAGVIRAVSIEGGDPVLLAAATNGRALTVSADAVFWAEMPADEGAGVWDSPGRVRRVPMNGGETVTLAAAVGQPLDIAASDSALYLLAGATPGALLQVALADASTSVLHAALFEPVALALDTRAVYWLERGAVDPETGLRSGRLSRLRRPPALPSR